MSQRMLQADAQASAPGALVAAVPARPNLRGPLLLGLLVVFGLLGGVGTWAALAPLSSAAVAPGTVAVDTKRKTVQHLEGGIVRRILVREGERVAVGQPLVRLETTQAEATWQLYHGQLVAAQALQARLLAERDGREAIRFPAPLAEQAPTDPALGEILDGQRTIFAARRTALEGQRRIYGERVGQLASQIRGLEAQERAALAQLGLIQDEIDDVRRLVDQGLERRPRLRALERQAANLSGNIGEYQGNIAKAEQGIGETQLQILDLTNQRTAEVVAELRETQMQIADLQERLKAAEDILQRREILAPVAGSVVNLKTVTPGGVVSPGAALMDIVPEDEALTIQAQIRPTDIDTVHPGLPTQVRLIAYKQRTTPQLAGRLIYVSADCLMEERTGMPYYDAQVEVDRRELARLPQVHLYPGMPVQVMVVTGQRTLLDYLLQPLQDSLTRAFRED